MEFMKFPSLMPLDNTKAVESVRTHFGDLRFVVTEKIHGSNLSVVTDGVEVKLARRQDFLAEGENFYGVEYVADIIKAKALQMFKDMREAVEYEYAACDELIADGHTPTLPSLPRVIKELRIFFEFFGGHYPHPDVPALPNMGQVGKGGIWYAQDKSVSAFRMYVNGEVVDFYTMGALCMSYGIPVVPALFFGSLDECIEYSQAHFADATVIPFMQPFLDVRGKPMEVEGGYKMLPAIEGNIREGHVISPVDAVTFPNGIFPAFKHKNAKFAESKEKGTANREKSVVPVTERMSNQQCALYLAFSDLIVVERLKSVMSKEEFQRKDVQRALGLVIQDAIKDLCEHSVDVASGYDGLSTQERKQLMSELTRYTMAELRDAFFALV